MDMGIRGWMIVIGVLLVLAVLLDGYRRMRNDRHGNIRMSLKMGGGFDKDIVEDLYGSELPNGGARVVSRNQWENPTDRTEPSLGEESIPVDDDDMPSMAATEHSPDPLFDDVESGISAVRTAAPQTQPHTAQAQKAPAAEQHSSNQAAPHSSTHAAKHSTKHTTKHTNTAGQAPLKATRPAPQDFIVISVHARDDGGFKGEDLLHILLACDMRFGNKNIFHRYEEANGQGAIQFSVANMLEPGSFDLDNIQTFNTPGVTFFLTLPGPKDPETAFEYMVETANCVAKNLNGDMKDESHSVMTTQTLEHFRQRVKDFERKSLAHA